MLPGTVSTTVGRLFFPQYSGANRGTETLGKWLRSPSCKVAELGEKEPDRPESGFMLPAAISEPGEKIQVDWSLGSCSQPPSLSQERERQDTEAAGVRHGSGVPAGPSEELPRWADGPQSRAMETPTGLRTQAVGPEKADSGEGTGVFSGIPELPTAAGV